MVEIVQGISYLEQALLPQFKMMIEYLLGLIVSLAFFSVLTFYFMKHSEEEFMKKAMIPAFLIGVVHLIISILSLLWFIGALTYSNSDFLIIYSLLLLIQGFFLFTIIYNISNQNNKLFFFAFSYFLVFFAIIFLHVSFLNVFVSVYFLFVLLLSLSFLFRNDEYKVIGIFGMLYSGISILLQILVLIKVVELYPFSIIYSALLFAFLIFMIKHLKDNPLPVKSKKRKKKNYLFNFLRDFVFTLALINLVFIGTVVIHEFGHLMVSYLYDCASREIVYSGGFPDTQILCSNVTSNLFVSLGGILGPIIIGLILIFVGGKFLREIGLLMIGFNLIIASKDFTEIGLSTNLSIFFVITGVVLAVAGIILLAKSKAEDYVYSVKGFG